MCKCRQRVDVDVDHIHIMWNHRDDYYYRYSIWLSDNQQPAICGDKCHQLNSMPTIEICMRKFLSTFHTYPIFELFPNDILPFFVAFCFSANEFQNDGNQIDSLSSLPQASFNYINSIVGSGVIGIPYALHRAGFGLGLLLLIIVAIITDYSLILMVSFFFFSTHSPDLGIRISFEIYSVACVHIPTVRYALSAKYVSKWVVFIYLSNLNPTQFRLPSQVVSFNSISIFYLRPYSWHKHKHESIYSNNMNDILAFELCRVECSDERAHSVNILSQYNKNWI